MLFKVDHNNIMGATVEEAGTYNVYVQPSSEVTQSKSSGNDMMVLNYEVADGKYKGGQIRYHYLVWNGDSQQSIEQSIRRFNTLAVAAGAQDGVEIASLQLLLKACIGKVLSVTVDWEENQNGEYFLRVKSFGPAKQASEPNGVTRPQGKGQQSPRQQATSRPAQPSFNNQPFNGQQNNFANMSADDLPFA